VKGLFSVNKSAFPALVWLLVLGVVFTPLVLAALSPLQASRNVAYVVGGLAGIAALGFLLLQPLLAAGYLPGFKVAQAKRWHRWLGFAVSVLVAVHIIGLFITSPDDMSDALLLVAPTPFSLYGVIGLWSLGITVLLVLARSRVGIRYGLWKIIHNLLAAVVVGASVIHTLMIDGAMNSLSKYVLCACIVVVTGAAMVHLRVLRPLAQRSKA